MESLGEDELIQFLRVEGGRAKNSDLLARYQSLISHADPQLRAHHRQVFKEIINKVAVVKQEDGEKYVILKKRYQPLISDLANTEEMLAPIHHTVCSETPLPTSGMVLCKSENSAVQPSIDVPSPSVEQELSMAKNQSVIPCINVKDFSTVLQSQFTVQETEQEVFEDGGSSVGSASVALEPMEKEWLQGAASGNFSVLSQLLKQEPALAGKRDFTSGFTALHWAAKHGNAEMVTMLVNAGAEINIRDHGGYTPLHIAALHGYHQIMNLLICNYGAKENLRDYSGHLPAQYLKPNGPCGAANDAPQFHQARGERRNRKLASLFIAKSSGHSKKRWGSAEDLVEEEEEEEKGNSHYLVLPSAYLPVRKFSR